MGDMALTLDCPRGMSSGPCGEPQAVWGAGELGRWHNRGWWGMWLIKKTLPPNNTVLYLSAGCINPICIQYQSDGKPVSGSVTPSPSGCNSSFTSENQIHISEAHRTERAHFFCSSRSVSMSLMCVHANGVIVTRMSHSLCAPLPAGSASRPSSAPWTLPASSPGFGSVLTTRARHPSGSSQDMGLGKLSFLLLKKKGYARERRICSESGNSCLETPLCLWGWRAPHVCSSGAAPAWYGISHADFLQGSGFPACFTVRGAGGRACSRRWGVRASAASPRSANPRAAQAPRGRWHAANPNAMVHELQVNTA